MARRDLLPGIVTDACPPLVVFDSKRAIKRARRRAILRDLAQLVLLAGVDWMFVRWPYSHVPSLDRAQTLFVVALLNAGLLTHIIVSRTFPKWSARRIAATWCLSERARFFQGSSEQSR